MSVKRWFRWTLFLSAFVASSARGQDSAAYVLGAGGDVKRAEATALQASVAAGDATVFKPGASSAVKSEAAFKAGVSSQAKVAGDSATLLSSGTAGAAGRFDPSASSSTPKQPETGIQLESNVR